MSAATCIGTSSRDFGFFTTKHSGMGGLHPPSPLTPSVGGSFLIVSCSLNRMKGRMVTAGFHEAKGQAKLEGPLS